MAEIILTRGISGSGKTTWAKQQVLASPNVVRVNRDDIREELFGKQYHTRKPDPQKEEQVSLLQRRRAAEALKNGKTVIIDDTNLTEKFIRQWRRFAQENRRELTHKDFPISLNEALKRNQMRERVVPDHVIARQFAGLGPNGELKHWRGDYADKVKPRYWPNERRMAVSFDADGTLWQTAPIQHYVAGKYRDFDSFHRLSEFCEPNLEVLEMARQAHDAGFAIIITTARNEEYREVTQKWLDKHEIPFENLFMRKDGDMRKDYEVKKDMYEQEVNPIYDLVRAVDDNVQAVQNWKDQGIAITVVPGFGEPSEGHWDYNPLRRIENPFLKGRCLRCNRKLKNVENGIFLGPDCLKLQ